MRNFKSQKFTFLITLCSLILLMLRDQTLISPVPSAFGKEEGKKQEAKQEVKVESPSTPERLKIDSSNIPFDELAGKNIFSPERKEFSISPTDSARKPLVRPQVVLYGVTIAGDFKSATLVQPGRPLRKGEREMLTLKVGESIGEYKLAKVLPDRVTLEAGGDSFEVLLYDPVRPKQRVAVKTESQPATVTSTLPGSATLPSTPATTPGTQRITTPGQERVVPQPPTASGTLPTVTPIPTPTPTSPTSPPSTSYPYFPRRGGRVVPSISGIPTPPQPPQPQPGGP
ncbi:MAG: hypothetical protein ACPL6D_00900 [Thermodesulfobacteriota bacterium]